ncbi:MAG: NAD(P) transhydrogenase subunit alpha [Bdellovibrionales bacterium]
MSEEKTVSESWAELATTLEEARNKAAELAVENSAALESAGHATPYLVTGLTVFILACFVGYYVVWRVTPALHSPLMGITNAISSVIIVGAIVAVWPQDGSFSFFGFLGVILASVNIFGGFIITRRMLSMFKKKGA